MVMGKVRITKMGFTVTRNKPSTMAKIIAEPVDSTCTPGKK